MVNINFVHLKFPIVEHKSHEIADETSNFKSKKICNRSAEIGKTSATDLFDYLIAVFLPVHGEFSANFCSFSEIKICNCHVNRPFSRLRRKFSKIPPKAAKSRKKSEKFPKKSGKITKNRRFSVIFTLKHKSFRPCGAIIYGGGKGLQGGAHLHITTKMPSSKLHRRFIEASSRFSWSCTKFSMMA